MKSSIDFNQYAEIAQLVEQLIRNEKVGGSIPLFGTNILMVTPLLIDLFAFHFSLHL